MIDDSCWVMSMVEYVELEETKRRTCWHVHVAALWTFRVPVPTRLYVIVMSSQKNFRCHAWPQLQLPQFRPIIVKGAGPRPDQGNSSDTPPPRNNLRHLVEFLPLEAITPSCATHRIPLSSSLTFGGYSPTLSIALPTSKGKVSPHKGRREQHHTGKC